MSSTIVREISREMKRNSNAKYKKTLQTFFKEPIQVYGVRTPVWRRITGEYWQRVKALPKAEVFKLCEELLAIGNGEERGAAFDWAFRMGRRESHVLLSKQFLGTKVTKRRNQDGLSAEDFPRLERWLKTYVSNWGSCDSFCGGALGHFLLDHPEFLPSVRKWAKSPNRWLRRAAAVCHIIPNRNGVALDHAFEVADMLLEDDDDMVQKGYGWMLKEIANRDQRRVFEFVMARRDRMPRTALRYAIEKMPASLKNRAMARKTTRTNTD